MSSAIRLSIENPLTVPDIRPLIVERLEQSRALYPPESCHALDIDELADPSVTFWTIREGDALHGCGALKLTGDGTAEVKSMFLRPAARGRGFSRVVMAAIIDRAREKSIRLLQLETGHDADAAIGLYRSFGFEFCPAFPPYKTDPLSRFMQLPLG